MQSFRREAELHRHVAFSRDSKTLVEAWSASPCHAGPNQTIRRTPPMLFDAQLDGGVLPRATAGKSSGTRAGMMLGAQCASTRQTRKTWARVFRLTANASPEDKSAALASYTYRARCTIPAAVNGSVFARRRLAGRVLHNGAVRFRRATGTWFDRRAAVSPAVRS